MALNNNIQWKRISAEGVAIVVSILLAFSIEAWWSDYQDRAKEQKVLVGLKSEFERNLESIATEINYRKAVIQSILRIFDASVPESAVEPDVLDGLIGDITWWSNAGYSRGTIEDLLQSGGLSLIENEELRRLVASLPSKYEITTRAELNDQVTTRDVVVPYLNAHSSLTQISNTMAKGRPGTGQQLTPPIYPVVDSQDHTGLLRDQEFLGILVQEHWNHLEAIGAYESLTDMLERGIQLTDQELNN